MLTDFKGEIMSENPAQKIEYICNLYAQMKHARDQERLMRQQWTQARHELDSLEAKISGCGRLYGISKKEFIVPVQSDPIFPPFSRANSTFRLDRKDRTITIKVGQIVRFNNMPVSITPKVIFNGSIDVDEFSWAELEGTEECFEFFFSSRHIDITLKKEVINETHS